MSDELDRIARELFAAGSRESMPPELRERLLDIRRSKARRRPVGLLVASTVALAAGVALAVRMANTREPTASIDREVVAAVEVVPIPQPSSRDSASLMLPPASAIPKQPSAPKKAHRALSSSSPRPAAPLALASEIALLNEARSHLSEGDPVRALDVLARHAGAPGGSLRAEATLLRMEALAAAGRESESAALSREFVARYPESPLADRARKFSRGNESVGKNTGGTAP